VKLGFEPEQVFTMKLFLTDDAQRRAALVESILERVEALPGVRAVGTIQFLPLSGWTNNGPFHFVGRPKPADPTSMASDVSTVSRGYFEAMGTRLLRGRSFDLRDGMQSPRLRSSTSLVDRHFHTRTRARSSWATGLTPAHRDRDWATFATTA
jgi:hypothetical protein